MAPRYRARRRVRSHADRRQARVGAQVVRGGEGRQVTAGRGDELCPDDRAHAGQAFDDVGLRKFVEELDDLAVEPPVDPDELSTATLGEHVRRARFRWIFQRDVPPAAASYNAC